MNNKKNQFLDSFLKESGVSEKLTDYPQPLETWGKKQLKTPTMSEENIVEKPLELSSEDLSSLEDIRIALENFTQCGLKRYAKHTIIGEGITDSPLVMCIGEAPGADEDRLGRPFVGVSGQLLDQMLHSIGLSREKNTYISNILPWRPPGNRPPTQEEISLCLPFIQRQISLIRPRAILFLGGVPTQSLTNRTDGITRLRGCWLEVLGIPALPTFHPSYLLRTPIRKKEAWQDLLSLKKRLFT
ncbi:MAG: uracil-DNA glycosylase [Alphaproteobacteria bacterium]|nr:uracil-DNA glycosylase [Alphaproteobacteria bacterium]